MNVSDLLKSLRVPFRRQGESPHVSAGWVGLECPWCGRGTGKYGLGVSLDRGACNCWKCGPHSLKEVLHELTGLSWKHLGDLMGGLARHTPQPPRNAGKLCLPPGVGPLLPKHKDYLKKRGFDPDEVESLWGVRGIGVSSRLGWRLWIPVREGAEVVSWTTRALGDAQVRYVSARPDQQAVPAKEVVYGAELARHGVVITEGPLDAWAVGPGGVATLGVGFTTAQARKLAAFPVRVVCFDNEPAAQRRASRLCDLLAPFPGETYRVTLSGKDASRSPAAEVAELRRRFLS